MPTALVMTIEVGRTYGQLTVLGEPYRKKSPGIDKKTYRVVDVKCLCGKKKTVHVSKLLSGHTRSCGHSVRQRYQTWANQVFDK